MGLDQYSQNILVSSQEFEAEKKYWLERLGGDITLSAFPADVPGGAVPGEDGSISDPGYWAEKYRFAPEILEKLNAISRNSNIGLYLILLTVVEGLLYRYTGNEDPVVGMPVFRSKTGIESLNRILLLRNIINENASLKDLLLAMKQTVTEADQYANFPFGKMVEFLNLQPQKDSLPRINIIVLLEEIHDSRQIQYIQADTVFSFGMGAGALELNLQYNPKLYQRETVQRLVGHLNQVLGEFLARPQVKLTELDTLSAAEKQQIIYEFNDTRAGYPKNKTISQWFEEQVEATPDNTAVVFEGQTLTYRELNHRSNQLAKQLREKGVKPDAIVGIMVEHSLEMLIGIMGVLKAGGAYLPMDSKYPEERIRYMLEDSQAEILLTQAKFKEGRVFGCETIELDNANTATDCANLEPVNTPRDLVYVIYTSGSTGKPKGVMIEHQGLVNYISWASKMYVKAADDSFALYSSLSFDLTVTSVFTPLIGGQKIFVYRDDEPEYVLFRILRERQATIVKLTPSHLTLMKDMDNRDSAVRRFIVGGEDLKANLAAGVHQSFGGQIEIYNEYGPTETVVGCMIYRFNPESDTRGSVPIGIPGANVQIYIWDKFGKILPVGSPGELIIAGDGVARGYLNRPELTTEKFVSGQFIVDSGQWTVEGGQLTVDSGQWTVDSQNQTEEQYNCTQLCAVDSQNHAEDVGFKNCQLSTVNCKLYKTGDLARRLPDGNIEYLGRIDHQVKIRGFRIELGEIEAELLKHSAVKEAVVVAREGKDGSRYLCAFLVLREKRPGGSFREDLAPKLPEYMIPSHYVILDSIPLTPNGKVDRKTLTDSKKWVDFSAGINAGKNYAPPGNEIEKKLVEAWQEVLGIEPVGILDGFFESGGDSIKAFQVTAKLQKYQLRLDVQDLLLYQNISAIGRYVVPFHSNAGQGMIEGMVALTPIQYWFFEKEPQFRSHYNQAVMLYRKEGYDAALLSQVFERIIFHHDALRMVFKNNAGVITQLNRGLDGVFADLKVTDLSGEDDYPPIIETKANQMQRGIDLENGPLLKLELFKTRQGDHLLIVIHHLVVDGVSWRILFEDFTSGYQMALEHGEIRFPAKTDSYQEWSEKMRSYAESEGFMKEIDFWNRFLGEKTKPLPKDQEIEKRLSGNAKELSMTLSETETADLLKNVNRAFNTEINDILLAALGLTLTDWTGENKILLELEGHGRITPIKNIDISRTIGWFTNVYPVILDMENREDPSHLIKKVKEDLRRIPNQGIGFGVIKYLAPESIREAFNADRKPEICFNYLGQFDNDLQTDIFGISHLSPGLLISPELERDYALEFNGLISDGKLRFSIRYNQDEYREHTMRKLIENYQTQLLNLIHFCMGRDETELTPTDLGYSKLSIEQLADLTGELEDLIDN